MTGYILTWFTRPQTVTHPSTNPAVHGWELNSQPVDHKSDALTTLYGCVQLARGGDSDTVRLVDNYN